MKIKKIINGLLALLITGGVLLLSDLSNRNRETAHQASAGTASSYAVKGQQYKMGLTYFAPEEALDNTLNGLWDGLEKLGFVKDSNLSVIAQHANGEMANLNPIHLNMDNQDVDMVLTTSTPGITAAISAVTKHPIVFTYSYTPLEAGAGNSFTDHHPNITGVGSFPPVEKTFDFIRESFPGAERIGTLYNSSEANSIKVTADARAYCKEIGVELVEATVINTSEVYQAISVLAMRNIDALWITGDNTALQSFHAIAKVCKEKKIPIVINDFDFMVNGAVAAVGISWYGTGLRTAKYVARVLNGESPADIPIENYVDEIIGINAEVAAELGVEFPEKYLHPEQALLKGKNYKLCLAHYIDSPNSEDAERGIKEELSRIGLVEGTDYSLKVFNAQGDVSTLNSIADAIAGQQWDLIFTTSTPTIQVMANKVTNTPIVFTNVGDPIRAGLGESFQKHPDNITGISTMSDFAGLVQLVKKTIPGLSTIGTIYTPGEINSLAYKEALEKAAQAEGIQLVAIAANTATEVSDAALSIASQGIQAFAQISDNLTASCGASIIKVAYNTHIPYFAFIGNQVEQGAVAAVARDYYYAGVDAVSMAQEILQGKSPAAIPYRFVKQSNLSVNDQAVEYFKLKLEH